MVVAFVATHILVIVFRTIDVFAYYYFDSKNFFSYKNAPRLPLKLDRIFTYII